MPFFDVKIPVGAVHNDAHEQNLLNIGFEIDSKHEADASCLFGIFDGIATFDIRLDCVDMDSARLNALYMVLDAAAKHDVEIPLKAAQYKILKCEVAR